MGTKRIVTDIIKDRKLVGTLAKNDFKTKFAGSYLGTVWAFVQPVVTTLVYWFVFEVGLRASRDCDYTYVVWLMSGLVPWFFFSDALNGGTNSLIEYNYLVKKVVFNISVLPVIKIISALIVNIFFVCLVFLIAWGYGYTPDLYSLQLIYYGFAMFILVAGLSYLTSAIVGFFRDLTQIIGIVLQVGMWMTPILWDAKKMLSDTLLTVMKINPMYYIVDGFRDAILQKTWFWEKGSWTIYFWIVTLVFFYIGTKVFEKLRVHFADVL